jgi:allantoicase
MAGVLEQVEIDTNYFKGNFPNSCEMHGIHLDVDRQIHKIKDEDWTLILPQTKLGPHRQQSFQLENVEAKTYTHVKLTIHPDGGVQRVRVIGRQSDATKSTRTTIPSPEQASLFSRPTVLPTPPLTPDAFAPYGQVLQAYGDHANAPKGVRITPANGGSASKFHKLALMESSYPTGSGATTGVSIYRCKPSADIAEDGTLELKVLERHRFTNQAFIPMGHEELGDSGRKYVVVVAENGEDDKPDMGTLRAFIASSGQGVVYGKAIWRKS